MTRAALLLRLLSCYKCFGMACLRPAAALCQIYIPFDIKSKVCIMLAKLSWLQCSLARPCHGSHTTHTCMCKLALRSGRSAVTVAHAAAAAAAEWAAEQGQACLHAITGSRFLSATAPVLRQGCPASLLSSAEPVIIQPQTRYRQHRIREFHCFAVNKKTSGCAW